MDRNVSLAVFAVLVLAAVAQTIQCTKECPPCSSSTSNSVVINSGTDGHGSLGSCPLGTDPLTTISSSCTQGSPELARIYRGNSLCLCGSQGMTTIDGEDSQPISASCQDATSATFWRSFSLPTNSNRRELYLRVAADDWCRVFLNDHSIGTVTNKDYTENVGKAFIITDSSLFLNGENFLRFQLVNSPSVGDSIPILRSSEGDCMWLEYTGKVLYSE